MQLVTAVTPSSVRRSKKQKMYYGIDGSSQIYSLAQPNATTPVLEDATIENDNR